MDGDRRRGGGILTPSTTSAVLIDRFGPPEALVEGEVPLRAPAPGEVHLRILAAGVNFADLLQRAGLYGTVPDRPYSPGFEVAGEVVGVGEGVKDWEPGDRGVSLLRHGGYARDVLVPTSQLFPYPESLSPAEAAAVPVVFLTAWVCLFEAAHGRPGETVLILGAGGGGFLLLYAPPERHPAICEALPELRPISFRFERQGSKLIYVEENGYDAFS